MQLLLTASTEILQYLLSFRYIEIDDIILNVFGTLIRMFVQKWMNRLLIDKIEFNV